MGLRDQLTGGRGTKTNTHSHKQQGGCSSRPPADGKGTHLRGICAPRFRSDSPPAALKERFLSEGGKFHNLDNKLMSNKLLPNYVKEEPFLVVGSPPCTHFSQMQNINPPPSPEQMTQSIAYVELCVAMCKSTASSFVFESKCAIVVVFNAALS